MCSIPTTLVTSAVNAVTTPTTVPRDKGAAVVVVEEAAVEVVAEVGTCPAEIVLPAEAQTTGLGDAGFNSTVFTYVNQFTAEYYNIVLSMCYSIYVIEIIMC